MIRIRWVMKKHFDCFYVPTIKVIKHVSLDMCWLINQLIEPQVKKPEKNCFIVFCELQSCLFFFEHDYPFKRSWNFSACLLGPMLKSPRMSIGSMSFEACCRMASVILSVEEIPTKFQYQEYKRMC